MTATKLADAAGYSAAACITALLGWLSLRAVRRLFCMTGFTTETTRGFVSAICSAMPRVNPKSYSCPKCQTRYPPEPAFKRCLKCVTTRIEPGGSEVTKPTRTINSWAGPTIRTEEARAAYRDVMCKRREAFEAFYRKHDEHRQGLGKPDPEEIGAMEGRRQVRALRALEATWQAD